MHNTAIDLNNHPLAHRRKAGDGDHGLPPKGPGEGADEDEEGLALPVNPDEGVPLVPDEEGNVEAPA